MCARPRRVSDEEIFEAALRAMRRLHPRDLTLAAIGAEAGITAGALVQRFGSKKELLLALARRGAEGSDSCIADPAALRGSPLAAIEAWVGAFSRLAESPDAFRRSLAYLQEDLEDPELRALLARQGRANRAALAALIRAAREAGELNEQAEPERLARLLEALISGGMVSWAAYHEGKAETWMRRLVGDFLGPYRAGPQPPPSRSRRGR